MVKSILDPSIIYQETKNIDKEDKHYDAQVYEISLFSSLPSSSTAVNIVLGQPKYTFVDKKVVYYPIYLIINDKVSTQIGVYEVPLDDLPKILDADGDIDLELLNEPLLFAFTTPEEIKRLQNPLRMSTSSTITLQSEETALKEREDFKKNSKPLWIQKFMENNNYKIVDNEGKGECLFAVIRDGLKGGLHNKDVSVDQMREMLAKEVDEDLYMNYLTLYKNAKEQDQAYAEELKGLVQRNKDLKEKLQKEKDRNKQMAIITQAEEVAARHKLLSEDKKSTRAMLTEFEFMKGVKNIAELKAKIQTCEFWGNTWAISTLERILRIKLILLSEENYKAGDIDNVLQCGQLNDDKLGENFEPTHYILACYQGWHYQLITYKGKGALNFNEIPYDIKMLIASKCLERLAGPYFIIPAFRDFMEEIKEKKTPSKEPSSSSSSSSLITSLTSFSAASFTEKTLEEISKELSEEIQSPSDLYDNKTTFQFYSKSLDKALPGHGVGEKISGEEEKNGTYKELAKIKSWRRKLANEWTEAPFKLDGQVWQSVEQYYEASKYKKDHRDIYAQYSLAKEPHLLTKGIRTDKDFFMPIISISDSNGNGNSDKKIKRSEKELEDALRAKFTQNPDLMLLLKATKKAKLQQFKRSAPPIICEELMRVRKELI
jgi:hypothetical protein